MRNLFFINPIGDHKVFNGWNKFFDKFFDYKVLCDCELLGMGTKNSKYFFIGGRKRINLKTNFINIYKKNLKFEKDDILLLGDIFTNTLPYVTKGGKKIYYSEFFLHEKPFVLRVIFFVIGLLFFHNKKFILQTKFGIDTFGKISNKCFYLPMFYDGDICYSEKNYYETVNFLFVGRIDDAVKNINFLVDNFLVLKKKYDNISLTLVGKIYDADFEDRYSWALKQGIIKHIDFVNNSKDLSKIYANNDILILPSPRETIGAVIQESMAHGCAVIASNACGGSCFIEEGKNGFVFKVNDSEDFRNKIELLLNNIEKLKAFKKKSTEIIKENYDVNNNKLMNKYFEKLNNFINGK